MFHPLKLFITLPILDNILFKKRMKKSALLLWRLLPGMMLILCHL
nr:MAG TPA: hypothetical protein [Caudoviricetes sp.]